VILPILFSIFFKSYTEKVWCMSCDEISADWAAHAMINAMLTVRDIVAGKNLCDIWNANDWCG
jgi:hypothetical protein